MAADLPAKRKAQTQEVERSLEELSRWMDGLFRIPGTGWRIGLDAIAGIIPGLGDIATSLISFYILIGGVRYRVPKITLLRMSLNIGIDYLIGLIPFVGDFLDIFWKSNKMNLELLKSRATVSAAEAHSGRTSDWLFVGAIISVLTLMLTSTVIVTFYSMYYVLQQVSQMIRG